MQVNTTIAIPSAEIGISFGGAGFLIFYYLGEFGSVPLDLLPPDASHVPTSSRTAVICLIAARINNDQNIDHMIKIIPMLRHRHLLPQVSWMCWVSWE